MDNATIEIKVPIHEWIVKRANYDPGFRDRIERELGRQAFAAAKELAK